jgi:hypothetical protein
MQSQNISITEEAPGAADQARVGAWSGTVWEALLIGLILAGVAMRFLWVDWHQGANLHPDEYGLTNTLTQIHTPASVAEYFNTRLSPLSPYRKYDLQGNPTAEGPDNGMRWGQWPQILLRVAAEATGNTGYDDLRVMGRSLSALADTLSLLLFFLAAARLYNRRVALLATALSALAVMQIQQSHFMTVDNFAVLFSTATMYCAVRIAQTPSLIRKPGYGLNAQAGIWYLGFGLAFGMAVASRINLLPLGGMVLIAAFLSIADLKLKSLGDLPRILGGAALFLGVAALAAGFAFRVAQPMSFRSTSGDTTLLTLHLNPDWVANMRVSMRESSGSGGGPPAEQWAHRIPILFPWINIVVWGMGLPLGLAAWSGLLWAAWRSFRQGESWRSHLLPLVWVSGFFLFMGSRWAYSIRYFLPIYPFLCLFAAWALDDLWRRKTGDPSKEAGAPRAAGKRGNRRAILPAILALFVLAGTLAWAWAFTGAVYRQDHTRIQASDWIYENIPAPFHLAIQTPSGLRHAPVSAPADLRVSSLLPFVQPFVPPASGELAGLTIPHAAALGASGQSRLRIVVASDEAGENPIAETSLELDAPDDGLPGPLVTAKLTGGEVEAGKTYYLIVSHVDGGPARISRSIISNENWDEGLPLSREGRAFPGQVFSFLQMEVRWYDDENKRQMFLDNLAQVDFIFLPSQRGIWSTCRLPRTYPMTMEYYRALFDGRLGFDLAAVFTSPLRLGPLQISDVGGTAAWNRTPPLPVFNNNLLAAEEAFSVYDHPPVWIFKKRADFDLLAAQRILGAIDLSQVVVQAPSHADGPPCQP